MAHINLLPWREERRKERQREFGMIAGFAAFLSVVIVAYIHTYIGGMIETQEARNSFLTQEIAQLDKKIAEIKNLEKQRAELLARMTVIQELQRSRPEVVHVVDDLVRTLPDGVYYTNIKQEGGKLTLTGIADSNGRVANFMRNLETSGWLEQPSLDQTQAYDQDGQRATSYILRVSQKQPEEKAETTPSPAKPGSATGKP
ncbi:MAG: PilN domain-containing protein [Gammaproteobacteria bacterium]|nr:PilN domain-containing protein [Gammaproteobacteria bacterium]